MTTREERSAAFRAQVADLIARFGPETKVPIAAGQLLATIDAAERAVANGEKLTRMVDEARAQRDRATTQAEAAMHRAEVAEARLCHERAVNRRLCLFAGVSDEEALDAAETDLLAAKDRLRDLGVEP